LDFKSEKLKLASTAVVGDGNAAVHYALRWMTPTVEVDLCGHATLGAAHALYDTGRVADDQPILFHTRNAGLLTVTKHQGTFQALPRCHVPSSQRRRPLSKGWVG